MTKPLVIVESKTKADTISRFLGGDYVVKASYGHVRDLPRKELGVDVAHHFTLRYAPPEGRARQVVTELRRALRGASEVYLATDEDREGEAIAWHLVELLRPDVPVKRMVFHEITREAITEALEHPRALDMKLVEAQEGRRALDRLVGWEVSPVLWRRVGGARSAGRVQSVATRLVVERERERMAHRPASYWDLEAVFEAAKIRFAARLASVDGLRVATGRDFDPTTGRVRDAAEVRHLGEADAVGLAERLRDATFAVGAREAKPFTERPRPPFKTTTLQQEAANRLRFSAARTMAVAQRLYERGFITYMRTDSVKLSEQAIGAARAEITERFGVAYVPDRPRTYTAKVRNAQEAHEAIRPAGARFRAPEAVAAELDPDERALYDLIWRRTLASQMPDARGETVLLRIAGRSAAGEEATFRAAGRTYEFPGYRRVWEGSPPVGDTGQGAPTAVGVGAAGSGPDGNGAGATGDVEGTAADAASETRLPTLRPGDPVTARAITPVGHTTQPPARYTEATLVRRLEELGIGRPSTYATIIETITHERGYVWKKGSALVPTWTAFAKTQLLERYFPRLVDYDFTATMEEALDEVANGRAEAEKWLHAFYFGNGDVGLAQLTSEEHLARIDMSEVNAIRVGTDPEGRELVVRVWRNGESLYRGEEKVPLPPDLAPDELTVQRAVELLEQGRAGPRVLGTDPDTGLPVLVLTGRYGPFVQLGDTSTEGGRGAPKPKRASLLRTMDPATLTLDDALALLSLPRVVGESATGEPITAQNGRFGPYLKRGTETRSLDDEAQIFTVTLEEAEARFAEPKRRGRAAKPPLAELGPHPDTGAPVRVLDGRYGPYVTDGTTNASVPRGTDPGAVDLARAVELLRERAARGSGGARTRRTTAKRAPAKRTPAKTAAQRPGKSSVKTTAGDVGVADRTALVSPGDREAATAGSPTAASGAGSAGSPGPVDRAAGPEAPGVDS